MPEPSKTTQTFTLKDAPIVYVQLFNNLAGIAYACHQKTKQEVFTEMLELYAKDLIGEDWATLTIRQLKRIYGPDNEPL